MDGGGADASPSPRHSTEEYIMSDSSKTDRQITYTYRQIYRITNREKQVYRQTERDIQTDRETDKCTNTQTFKQIDKHQTDRYTHRNTNIHTNRRTD